MFNFKQFILEDLALIFEAKSKGVKAGNAADSRGKLAEGLVAQHMLGGEGNHPEDYRIEGKKPVDVHQVHGTFLYGANFRKHSEYKQISNAIGRAVNELKTHIKKKYGINRIARVAATSQTSEHESETGLKDPHFKGDVVATGAYNGGDHKKGKKVAISIKFYTGKNKPTNWANHGMKSMQDFSEADFSKHREEHEKTLSKFKIPKNEKARKEWYKALPEKKRNQLNDSYRRMVIGVAGSYAAGLKKKHHNDQQPIQDENLKSFIKKNVGAAGQVEGGNVLEGKTHLPHAMLKLKQKSNGEFTHRVTDISTHVHNYLSHFRNLRVEHGEGDLGNTSSVTITGEHKTTGERMALHRTAIYGGSTGHSTKSGFRTQTTLPSEDHKSVNTDSMLKEEADILLKHKSTANKKSGAKKLKEEISKASIAAQIFEAQQKSQSISRAIEKNQEIYRKMAASDANNRAIERNIEMNSAEIASKAIRRSAKTPDNIDTRWVDNSGQVRGLQGGARVAGMMTRQANLGNKDMLGDTGARLNDVDMALLQKAAMRINQKMKGENQNDETEEEVNEEAPANSMGAAGISGLSSAVDVGIAGRDMLLAPGPLRRPPPKMFGGKRVFTVPSSDYYKATLGRKKGQHWRSMVAGPLGEEIRQYALDNKDAPIIVEDETTGAMMYLRYGKR